MNRPHEQARRARKLNQACVCLSSAAVKAAWSDGVCYVCGAPAEHIDHLVSLKQGGWGCISNLRPACARCNLRKGGHRSVADLVKLLNAEGVVTLPTAFDPGPPCPAADERAALALELA